LRANNLDNVDVINVFQVNKITLENMKYLKDSDLANYGIREWGTRMNIIESINKYYANLNSIIGYQMPPQNYITNMNSTPFIPPSHTPPVQHPPPPQVINIKRKYEDISNNNIHEMGTQPPNKKPRVNPNKNLKIRYKDLESLVSDSQIPVDFGSTVMCSESNIIGQVTKNKQKKPVIKFTIKGKEKMGTISQFYKQVTGKPLQAKGDSWSNIFFTDVTTGITRSLLDIKYLMKGPKKVVSAFLHYSKEVRETIRSTSDFAKKSGESWKTLPEDKKTEISYKRTERQRKISQRKKKNGNN